MSHSDFHLPRIGTVGGGGLQEPISSFSYSPAPTFEFIVLFKPALGCLRSRNPSHIFCFASPSNLIFLSLISLSLSPGFVSGDILESLPCVNREDSGLNGSRSPGPGAAPLQSDAYPPALLAETAATAKKRRYLAWDAKPEV